MAWSGRQWSGATATPSLPEIHSSLPAPRSPQFFRKLVGYAGPGFLIAVGYMDPGNWATDLAAGSQFGYRLLFAVTLSSLVAILLQSLAIKLGVVGERDLAQACRDSYGPRVSFLLWLLAEVAIAACDLAEIIGSAIALKLLFHLPLAVGVAVTALDVFLLMLLENKGFRYIEAIVAVLTGTICLCFGLEILFSRPDYAALLMAMATPDKGLLTDRNMLYLAVGILGATVMPHNLYLHSAVVQSRDYERTPAGKREALRFCNIDSAMALGFALFVNAAILAVAAAVFHRNGHTEIAGIEQAFELLTPLLGVKIAGVLFAVALLASGQNSTLTGTLAGQIVMEGFVQMRMRPWLRRLTTRLLALGPAMVVAIVGGEKGVGKLLILSQVVLSLQLSFAVFPLVIFTSDRAKMGEFVNRAWVKVLAWTSAFVIAILNLWLLYTTFFG